MSKFDRIIAAILIIALIGGTWSVLGITGFASERNTRQTIQKLAVKDERTLIEKKGIEVLKAIKSGDPKKLAAFVDPKKNLVLSMYPSIMKGDYVSLSKSKLTALGKKTKLQWGYADGTGAPVKLTFGDFKKKYLWNHDYLSKEIEVNYGSSTSRGNIPANYMEKFKEGIAIEYFYPGTEEYAQMDWSSIILIFEKTGDRYYLSCIALDYWTV